MPVSLHSPVRADNNVQADNTYLTADESRQVLVRRIVEDADTVLNRRDVNEQRSSRIRCVTLGHVTILDSLLAKSRVPTRSGDGQLTVTYPSAASLGLFFLLLIHLTISSSVSTLGHVHPARKRSETLNLSYPPSSLVVKS